MSYDHYHAMVVKAQLTRHIPQLMPDIVDETQAAFKDLFNIGDGVFLP